ncbi:Uncharacterised protein [uncultured archaeon]|nr:Uncharacterised protein [uncultured archaeon]
MISGLFWLLLSIYLKRKAKETYLGQLRINIASKEGIHNTIFFFVNMPFETALGNTVIMVNTLFQLIKVIMNSMIFHSLSGYAA